MLLPKNVALAVQSVLVQAAEQELCYPQEP